MNRWQIQILAEDIHLSPLTKRNIEILFKRVLEEHTGLVIGDVEAIDLLGRKTPASTITEQSVDNIFSNYRIPNKKR